MREPPEHAPPTRSPPTAPIVRRRPPNLAPPIAACRPVQAGEFQGESVSFTTSPRCCEHLERHAGEQGGRFAAGFRNVIVTAGQAGAHLGVRGDCGGVRHPGREDAGRRETSLTGGSRAAESG